MGWKSMGRYLPQVAEVTKILGPTVANELERRNPKLGSLARVGLEAVEALTDEAEDNASASSQATGIQYPQPQVPFPSVYDVQTQYDDTLSDVLRQKEATEHLPWTPPVAEATPLDIYSPPYGEEGTG